jgi:hypothetical protein
MLRSQAARSVRRALMFFSLCLAAFAAPSLDSRTQSVAEAGENEIHVGDQLQAVNDVTLDQAQIRKGSRVSVAGRTVRSGLVFLDVALADGHVVKAQPLTSIRRTFRLIRG